MAIIINVDKVKKSLDFTSYLAYPGENREADEVAKKTLDNLFEEWKDNLEPDALKVIADHHIPDDFDPDEHMGTLSPEALNKLSSEAINYGLNYATIFRNDIKITAAMNLANTVNKLYPDGGYMPAATR